MTSNEIKLSDFIDRLNAERKPDEDEHTTDSPELKELYRTVKRVRTLREPALPESDFSQRLVQRLKAAEQHTRRQKVWPWLAGLAGVAMVFLFIGNLFFSNHRNMVYAMEQAFQEVQAYHGVMEVVETNAAGESLSQAKVEVWAAQDGSYYTKGLEGAGAGVVTVNNGEQKWQVLPDVKEVHTYPEFPDSYRFAFELGQEIDEAKKALSVEEVGEEPVAGREAVVLKIVPDGGEAYHLWVDKETKLPLQKESALQKGLQYRITYTSMEFDEAIPAELVAFRVPEGYMEVSESPEQTIRHWHEAEHLLGFAPAGFETAPAGYSLDRIAVVTDEGLVKVYYSNKEERFVFTQGKAKDAFTPAPTAILGKLDGHTAAIQAPMGETVGILSGGTPYGGAGFHSLVWQEDGFAYAVQGGKSQESLIAFTEQLTDGTFEVMDSGGWAPEVEVPVDWEKEKNDQKSVDSGSSPWRLDPAFVAQVFASLKLSPEGISGEYPIKEDELKVVQNDGVAAVVEITNEESPVERVYLQKLVRQDETGIWTVVGYDER